MADKRKAVSHFMRAHQWRQLDERVRPAEQMDEVYFHLCESIECLNTAHH